MANPMIVLEDVNLYCGTGPDDSAASNHLILSQMKLPMIDHQFVDHRGGGTPIAMEVDTVIARLESTFVLAGLTPQVMKLVSSWSDIQNWFYIYGTLRDQATGEIAQAAALLHGKLGRTDPENWQKGNVLHVNYSIRGINHFELQLAGEEMYRWDWATNTYIVGGVDRNAQRNAFLAIPSVNASAGLGNTNGFVPGA